MGTSHVLRRMVLAGGVCAAAAGGWMGALTVAGAEVRNPTGVAVLIGNRDYEHRDVPDVEYAGRDAEGFRRYLVDVLGFDPDNVIHVTNASRREMFDVLGTRGDSHSLLWSYLDPDGGSEVVVFYSGHGVPGTGDGQGYLLPVDADPKAAEDDGYPLNLLYENLGRLEEASSVHVYLDACFSGGSHKGGLVGAASPVYVTPTLPEGTEKVTALTASSGTQLASWDEEAEHGMFTHHLLDALYGKGDADGDGAVTAGEAKKYLDRHMTRAVRRMHRRVQKAHRSGSPDVVLAVASAGGGFPQRPALERVAGADGLRQEPAPVSRRSESEDASSARDVEESLGLDRDERMAVQEGLASLEKEVGVVDGVFGSRTRGALRAWQAEKGVSETGYLTGEEAEALVAMGREAREARRRAEAEAQRWAEAEEARKRAEAVARERERMRPGRKFRDCAECPELVVVPSGRYMMGSPRGEAGRDEDEGPRHGVTIGKPFAVGVNEVTFEEWEVCVSGGGCGGYRPDGNGWGRGTRPVIEVSWRDAQAYVEWLRSKTGEGYRLLSESEWEYVARAGTDTRYFWGDSIGRNRANCRECGSRWDKQKTAPVRSFEANRFGVYDLHGNVWEWVEDCWNDSYRGAPANGSAWESGDCSSRVARGGSWVSLPGYLRSAVRYWNSSGSRVGNVGFRIARTLTP